MVAAQKGVCAICGMPESSKGSSRLAVDHDHITNKVRGLLCTKCNTGLGVFVDNTLFLSKAIEYLEYHKNV